jgi:hypothetical protein
VAIGTFGGSLKTELPPSTTIRGHHRQKLHHLMGAKTSLCDGFCAM